MASRNSSMEPIHLAAVKRNGLELQRVPKEERTKAIYLAAFHNNWRAFQYVSAAEQTEDISICFAAFQKNGLALVYVPEKQRTVPICLAAVQNNWRALEYVPVPEDGQFEALYPIYLEAFQKNGLALEYVPEKQRTVAICLAAVQKDGRALAYVPVPEDGQFEALYPIYLEAVQQIGWSLRYVPEKQRTVAICLAAVKRDAGALRYVPVPEDGRFEALCPIYLAAVQQHGGALEYVPVPEDGQFEALCPIYLAAVQQHGLALEYVPVPKDGSIKDIYSIYLTAVKQNGLALAYVPENQLTEDLCLAAVKQNELALEYVPKGGPIEATCHAALQHAALRKLATLLKARVNIAELPQLSDENAIYKYIYEAPGENFSNQEKVAAFFIACRKELLEDKPNSRENKPNSLKINEMLSKLSKLEPDSLRTSLKTILRRMGGYSFMPEDAKNVTLGVEIEYSNIPSPYMQLIELVMECIQTGWSHPGDTSVKETGEKGYSGETTTPIIQNNSQLKNAMLNVAFLQAMGGEANRSCGLHVHIGVSNLKTPNESWKVDADKTIDDESIRPPYTAYQFEFIKQFLFVYKREESKFRTIERDYNKYTQAVAVDLGLKKVGDIPVRDIKTLSALTKVVNPGESPEESRYYELNLHAFTKHGTIEIRRFSGTTDEAYIYQTLSMISAMAEEARTKTNAVFSKKSQEADAACDEKHKPEPYRTSEVLSFIAEKERTKTKPVFSKKSQEADELSLRKQGESERQGELFTLRVKPLHQKIVTQGPDHGAPNTVYINFNPEDGFIHYETRDKNNKLQRGCIEDVKGFRRIIDNLKTNIKLTQAESNQILQKIAGEGHASISNPVEQLTTNPDFLVKFDAVALKRKNSSS